MNLTFKGGITVEIIDLSCKSIFFEPVEDQIDNFKGLRTKCRRKARRKCYVFLDPVKIQWEEGKGPKRWTNKDTLLPPMHYTMLVITSLRPRHLTIEWFDIAPTEDVSLDFILQIAISVIEFCKYA